MLPGIDKNWIRLNCFRRKQVPENPGIRDIENPLEKPISERDIRFQKPAPKTQGKILGTPYPIPGTGL